ncbi:transcriptional regulator, AraC family [Duganella sp. CF458]|uniref:AraC family transcriptional regulator n=1 Tax=Duganella sp. CF458 TaxID=1884368 RepID=UPI0008EC4E5E|nr:AraC family transcriptional regulator [Duganella sp. CF458]SFG01683.1 transcriptional regulator, AraC family [Duganella sp. CF458]
MPIIHPTLVDIDIRSYGERWTADQHTFAQLVLPLSGEVELDIEGRGGRLNPLKGAVVVAGAWHSQQSNVENHSLIVDVDQAAVCQPIWEQLADRPFPDISPAARKLVEFMQLSIAGRAAPPSLLQGWVPLLLDTLTMEPPRLQSRLAALLAHAEANLALPWTTESMAQLARMSVSRLHALFRDELETSPRAWLLSRRLNRACELLRHTSQPIADIALSTGFGDQSALTRAMRVQLDTTPAAYRRLEQEPATKNQ